MQEAATDMATAADMATATAADMVTAATTTTTMTGPRMVIVNGKDNDDDDPLWKVWLTRILVTIAIALFLEYLGMNRKAGTAKPATLVDQEENDMVVTIQYKELTSSVGEMETKDQVVDEYNGTSDQDAEPTAEDDDDEMYEEKECNDKVESADDDEEPEKANDDEDNRMDQSPNGNLIEDNVEIVNAPTEAAASHDATARQQQQQQQQLRFKNKSIYHPGMGGFHHWYDIETSLFRQYNVGRTDGVNVIPPYVPKSRNGQVRVALRVTNYYAATINVYWMNYQGHEESKGSIMHGETWTQTTFVEHPWVFRMAPSQGNIEEPLLLHYIPERVIPHLDEAPTTEDAHPLVGVQRFSITTPTDIAIRDNYICSVHDDIMPHPAKHHFHNPNQAHNWTLLQMKRLAYFDYNPGAALLTKYLTNIAMHPENANYRHIRIANKKFAQGIWQTPARGLLLAAGFVEQHAFAELGTAEPLSRSLVQDVSLVLFRLEQCLTEMGLATTSAPAQQPDGADGSGRAGFRRP